MKSTFFASVSSLLLACIISCNTTETKSDWTPLFNGKDLSGWTAKIYPYEVGNNYANTFRVVDSVIQVNYDGYGEKFDDRFGHLYYDIPYSHYHLKLEYRFYGDLYAGAPDYTLRNSGIMFHSQDPRSMLQNQNWPISVEMQFLGGLNDSKDRSTGNMCSPGTDIVYNGELLKSHCLSSSSKTYHGDQWVKAELIVLGDSLVQHIIEGDTVLTYTKPQIGGDDIVTNYDPKIMQDGKLLKEGFIALQSEGQPIEFRNIYLKDLSQKTKK